MTVKILILDRTYSSWSFINPEDYSEIQIESNNQLQQINPIKSQLFSNDIFTIKSNAIDMVYSPVRTHQILAGVLLISENKTYGRTDNKKRVLYKCIPDDKHLPAFLVPYDICIEFTKSRPNKYVVFKFEKWTTGSHPQGLLVETLGNVDVLPVFYEYQLYCKSLHASLTEFTNQTKKTLSKQSIDAYIEQIENNPHFNIEDRSSEHIFTIDPINSLDFDDGLSIMPLTESTSKVSVYIANVFVWLETLGLWNSLSKRVATIYLPDRRRPMLPTILSDSLCSLQSGCKRFAFVLDMTIDNTTGKIAEESIVFKNAVIRVAKNYCYEEHALIYNKQYNQLLELSQKMDRSVKNSHDLVTFWMIQMNTLCGVEMSRRNIGIFRSAAFTNSSGQNQCNSTAISQDTNRVIQNWNNASGQYVLYDSALVHIHEIMNTQSYIHITSPIRRLVDLLNQIWFFTTVPNMTVSQESRAFLKDWNGKMEYINTAMRSIRKIQTDCLVLFRCFDDPTIMERTHRGVVFDKLVKNNGSLSYMVYLEDLKLLSRIVTHTDIENGASAEFKLFLFEGEAETKKKIRLQIL